MKVDVSGEEWESKLILLGSKPVKPLIKDYIYIIYNPEIGKYGKWFSAGGYYVF